MAEASISFSFREPKPENPSFKDSQHHRSMPRGQIEEDLIPLPIKFIAKWTGDLRSEGC